MINNFFFRITVTIIIFFILKIKNITSLPLLVAFLILSDTLDCGLYPGFINYKTYTYQKNDKIIDLLMYVFFIALFNNLFDMFTKKLLCILILFRIIGVIKFYSTGENKYLKYFPDFINSTLIAYAIYVHFSLTNNTYYIMIMIGMVIKIIFEIQHHDMTYN